MTLSISLKVDARRTLDPIGGFYSGNIEASARNTYVVIETCEQH